MSARKIVAILLAGVIVVAVLVVGLGYYLWQVHSPELRKVGQEVVVEATAFGKTTDNEGCLETSLARFERCDGAFLCSVTTNVFFLACLRASDPVPGFCDDIPAADSFADSVTWRLAQCSKHGLAGRHCGNFFGQMQKFCDSPAPK